MLEILIGAIMIPPIVKLIRRMATPATPAPKTVSDAKTKAQPATSNAMKALQDQQIHRERQAKIVGLNAAASQRSRESNTRFQRDLNQQQIHRMQQRARGW